MGNGSRALAIRWHQTEKEKDSLLASPSYSSGYDSRTPSPLGSSSALQSSSASRELNMSVDCLVDGDLVTVDIIR